jgi:hypothetical protein
MLCLISNWLFPLLLFQPIVCGAVSKDTVTVPYPAHAHENGQLIRFWATPDIPGKEREAFWTELLEAGVDLVNTDDLSGLRAFLLARGDESNE